MPQLLAGQMLPDIEQVFADLDLALFPADDLSLDCSCPDSEVPVPRSVSACRSTRTTALGNSD